MNNSVSINGVQGVDPMGLQDGMLSMLFDSGEGFDEVMANALMPIETEGGLLESGEPEMQPTDGLSLLKSELNGAMMPAFAVESQMAAGAPVSTVVSSASVELVQTGVDEGSPEPFEAVTESLESAVSLDLPKSDGRPEVAAQMSLATPAAKAKTPMKKSMVRAEETESRLEEVQSDREVSMEARIHDGNLSDEDGLEEWDSTHLQIEGEFDPIAANTAFAKSVQVLTPESRAAIVTESVEAAEVESTQENNKSETKKVAKVFDTALDAQEPEENPADSRVEVAGDRTVRVVLDPDLALEVSQEGDAVDVLVEGATEVVQEMRGATSEISESLSESGLHLRDFSTRSEDGSRSQQRHKGDRDSSHETAASTEPIRTIAHGKTLNVVA